MATHFQNSLYPPAGFAVAQELMPGDVVLGQAGDHLKTLLGSCISVILTDPRRSVGAMCHIVHVGQPNAANRSNTAYGLVAMEAMGDKLRAVGINPLRCVAYVYGGGNMFPQLSSGGTHVGQRNADWVLNYLQQHGIGVVDASVGGTGYRKLSWTVGPTEPIVEIVMAQGGAAGHAN